MYRISGNTIKLTRGDSFYCEVGIAQDGTPYVPVEGDVIKFVLKKGHDDAALITKIIPNDTLILHLEPNDTKTLEFGTYRYDVELTFANGDVDTFINNEVFILAPEVS